MRLAFVSTILDYPFGGADRLWFEAAAAAVTDGHSLLLSISGLTAAHPDVRRLIDRGAELHVRSDRTRFNGRIARYRHCLQRLVRARASLVAALDRFAPDVVVITQGGTYDILLEHGLLEWLRSTGCPYVLVCQSHSEADALSGPDRLVGRDALRNAHGVAFVSSHNRKLAEQQLGVPLRNAIRIDNPVALSSVRPLTWPTLPSIQLAAVARLERDKGLDVLLPAAAKALPRGEPWALDVYGRGPEEANLRASTDQLGLAEHVRFQGFVSNVAAIWRDHHLLVLPSRRAGCSLAMLEAMACGRPVLATRVGGVEDWIEAGVNGFICNELTVESLAHTLEQAWHARADWPRLGEAGFRKSRELDPAPGRTLLSLVTSGNRLEVGCLPRCCGPADRAI